MQNNSSRNSRAGDRSTARSRSRPQRLVSNTCSKVEGLWYRIGDRATQVGGEAQRKVVRVPGDPLGTMEGEQIIYAGTGAQINSYGDLGDYSAVQPDYGEDCTFGMFSKITMKRFSRPNYSGQVLPQRVKALGYALLHAHRLCRHGPRVEPKLGQHRRVCLASEPSGQHREISNASAQRDHKDVAHGSISLFAGKVLRKKLRAFQNIFGSCPFAKIFSQVPPAYHAQSVHQKFRRACNVLPVFTAAPVQQIIAANDFRFGVRQKRVSVSSLATERSGFIGRVHADRYRPHSPPLQLTQTLLNTPQLGVAERSPISPVRTKSNPRGFCPPVPGIGSESSVDISTIFPLVSVRVNSGAFLPNFGRAAAGSWREAYNVAYPKKTAAAKLNTARIEPAIFPR